MVESSGAVFNETAPFFARNPPPQGYRQRLRDATMASPGAGFRGARKARRDRAAARALTRFAAK